MKKSLYLLGLLLVTLGMYPGFAQESDAVADPGEVQA